MSTNKCQSITWADIERARERLAANPMGQMELVTREQLEDAGWTELDIEYAVASGWLQLA